MDKDKNFDDKMTKIILPKFASDKKWEDTMKSLDYLKSNLNKEKYMDFNLANLTNKVQLARHLSNSLKIVTPFLLLSTGIAFSQEAPVSAGGDLTGTNGNVSYSVGQEAYTTDTGTNGSVAQGVQQPYEIYTVLGSENFNINLQMTVFPNPTANVLTLQIKNYDFSMMNYQLFDLNGRLIESEKISAESTTIVIEKYPTAVYLLKVMENNKELKTFKIIKN